VTNKERAQCIRELKDARNDYAIGDYDLVIGRLIDVLECMVAPRTVPAMRAKKPRTTHPRNK
jgi:hypothetical protein